MCVSCNAGFRQNHFNPRRNFKGCGSDGCRCPSLNLFRPRPAAADDDGPSGSGMPDRRYVIRGGSVMTMDPKWGPEDKVAGGYTQADVSVVGKKIAAVGPNLGSVGGERVIDARGKIVMPGFINTHHHQFETASRSWLADGVDNDNSGSPSGSRTYDEHILLKSAGDPPQDVYINELFAGVRSPMTVSQRCMTSHRSTTRPSIQTPPSRR